VAYFSSHDDVGKTGTLKCAMEQLNDPLTQLILLFLNFILPAMNNFNNVKFVQMEHVNSKACVREV